MRYTRRGKTRKNMTRKHGGAVYKPLPQQPSGVFASESIPCFGEEGDFQLKKIMTNPQDVPSNVITAKYSLDRLLGGGKSGAYVFKIKNIDQATGQNFILKFYPNSLRGENKPEPKAKPATNGETICDIVERTPSEISCDFQGKQKPEFDERPFREVLALCSLQGKPGFSKLYEFGIMDTPVEWAPALQRAARRGLYVIMSTMDGSPLTQLSMAYRAPEFGAIIAWKLLSIIDTMRQTLGPSAEHFDFHPDNIFVYVPKGKQRDCEVITWKTPSGRTQTIGCPEVNIIDFDLIEGELYHSGNRSNKFQEELPEQHTKRVGFLPVPERTLQFCIHMIGLEKTLVFFAYIKRLKNTDIRNWWIIASCLMIRVAGLETGIQLCTNIDECLSQNKQIFSLLERKTKISANRYFPKTKEINAAELLVAKQILNIIDSFVVSVWRPYDTKVFNTPIKMNSQTVALQDHPTFDTTAIQFNVYPAIYHSDLVQTSPERIFGSVATRSSGFTIDLNSMFYLQFPYQTQVSILTNQIANLRILVNFNPQPTVIPNNISANQKQRLQLEADAIRQSNGLGVYRGPAGKTILSIMSDLGGLFGTYFKKYVGSLPKSIKNSILTFLSYSESYANLAPDARNQEIDNALYKQQLAAASASFMAEQLAKFRGLVSNIVANPQLAKQVIEKQILECKINMIDIKLKNEVLNIAIHLANQGEVVSIVNFLKTTLEKKSPMIKVRSVDEQGQSIEGPGLLRSAAGFLSQRFAANPNYIIELALPMDPNDCAKLKQWECEHPNWSKDYHQSACHFLRESACIKNNSVMSKLLGIIFSIFTSATENRITMDYDAFLTYSDPNKDLFDKGLPQKVVEEKLLSGITTQKELDSSIAKVNITKEYNQELEKLKENFKKLKEKGKTLNFSREVVSTLSDEYILYKIPLFFLQSQYGSELESVKEFTALLDPEITNTSNLANIAKKGVNMIKSEPLKELGKKFVKKAAQRATGNTF